jgi:hypothetical protein
MKRHASPDQLVFSFISDIVTDVYAFIDRYIAAGSATESFGTRVKAVIGKLAEGWRLSHAQGLARKEKARVQKWNKRHGVEGECALAYAGVLDQTRLSADTQTQTRLSADIVFEGQTETVNPSTLRWRKWRANQLKKQAMGSNAAASADTKNVRRQTPTQTLSLSLKDIDLDLKRESSNAFVRGQMPTSAVRMALPTDWQPNSANAEFALAELGDRGAANLTGNFCDHYWAQPNEERTLAQWQATFRKWVRTEHNRVTSRQVNLQLPIACGDKRAARASGVVIRQESDEAVAWESYYGKPFLWGIRSQVTVPTQWPPGHPRHEPDRKEAADRHEGAA